jgi:hypothetical protein
VLLAAVMAPVPYQSSGKAVQKLMLGLDALWQLLGMQPVKARRQPQEQHSAKQHKPGCAQCL